MNQATLDTAVGIARHAGGILREFYHKPRQQRYKGEVDLVTEADTTSEAYLVGALREAFPEYGITGEEGGSYRPEGMEYGWFVDPLDGTTNFAHRVPIFAVNLALTDAERRPVLAVTYNPMSEECYTAIRGGGAYLNGERLAVSETDELLRALLVTGFPYDRQTSPENNLREFNHIMMRAQGVLRLGSAALDLAFVAAGRVDGYWEQKLFPWDCLAGILLVEEAGGVVTDYEGNQAGLSEARPRLVTANPRLHPLLLAAVQEARGE